MKICVTSQADNLDTVIDPRFGRCQYFIIVDPENMEFKVFENPNIGGMGGVGVQSAQFLSEKDVEVVLTGNVGPNAFQTLEAAGIKVITGVSGNVKEAIEKYKEGKLQITKSPNVTSKFGMD